MPALNNDHKFALMAALGAAFTFLLTRANAAQLPASTDSMEGDPMAGPLDIGSDEAVLADSRVQAFLSMIRTLEHHPDDPPYQTFYRRGRFSNLADHPVLTGEMRGMPLPPSMCRAAGYADGICVSTAAGAYQFNVPTWTDMRGIAPRLPDFSPHSQDTAAVRLLRKIGALQSLVAGDFDTALRRSATRWASLPGSTAQQNPKSYDYALSIFLQHLDEA